MIVISKPVVSLALYVQQGHRVKFVSVTNGDAGHHEMGGGPLAQRRYTEAQAAAKVVGIEIRTAGQSRWRTYADVRKSLQDYSDHS